MAALPTAVQAESAVAITIDTLQGTAFSASKVAVKLDPARGSLHAEAGSLRISRHDFGRVQLECGHWRNDGNVIECTRAKLQGKQTVKGELRYVAKPESLSLRGEFSESSSVKLNWQRKKTVQSGRIDVVGVDPRLFAPFMPTHYPLPTGGLLDALMQWHVDPKTGVTANGQATWRNGAFSDAAGLRAGEKVTIATQFAAGTENNMWHFAANVQWREGEIYWQPLYLRAGHTVHVEGTLSPSVLSLSKIDASVGRVGAINGTLDYDVATKRIQRAQINAQSLAAEPLYDEWVKPLFEGKPLGSLRVAGRVSLTASVDPGGLERAAIRLDALSLEDTLGRFALFNADADIPWARNATTNARVAWEGAELGKLPIGAIDVSAQLHEKRVTVESLDVPVLDGKIAVRGLSVATEPLAIAFEGKISPISLPLLMSAFGGPALQGTIEGTIPRIAYEGGDLQMDGSLSARVFDGDVIIKHVSGTDLLGRVPRFRADIEAKRLDLDLVTRAFSFGRITGRIDAKVTDLEMMNWKPLWFDASIQSSDGRYSKRISQRAVQNISSLGGAGAAAAIQRSALRLFETFGYSKLGWTCRLRNNVCEMDGIERAPTGYVIVKGGGIPAITVLGYNRQVDWEELVTRLKRVTAPESKPVVEK